MKSAFAVFELVHVPREQNDRADLLAKLASSGKGGRQRTVIQETLKTPQTFVADNMVGVHQVIDLGDAEDVQGKRLPGFAGGSHAGMHS